jgi:hypothetical protein
MGGYSGHFRKLTEIKVGIEIDSKFAKSLQRLVSPKQYESAQRNAIRRALPQAHTAGNRMISRMYHIKMRDVRSLSVCNVAKGYISYGEGKRGRMLTTVHFPVSPIEFQSQEGIPVRRRRRHRLTIKNTTITRWFMVGRKVQIATGKHFLWKRTGPLPKQIQPVKAISIAQKANENVRNTILKTSQETYDKRIKHEVDRILERAGAK